MTASRCTGSQLEEDHILQLESDMTEITIMSQSLRQELKVGLSIPVLGLQNNCSYCEAAMGWSLSLISLPLPAGDEVAEWLRRWTANPLGSARVGSNPIFVGGNFFPSPFVGEKPSSCGYVVLASLQVFLLER